MGILTNNAFVIRILKAPTGDIKAKDETKKQQLLQKVRSVIPDKKLQDVLKGEVNQNVIV